MNKELLFACLLFLSVIPNFNLFAQEKETTDSTIRRIPPGVERSAHKFYAPIPKKVAEARIDPPFWWVGMENPVVELLIHDNEVATYEPSIQYPGVQIKNISRLANPNYLFLDLEIKANASPGEFLIVLKRGEEERKYRYELKQRDRSPEDLNPLSPADFVYLLMPDRFANGDPSNDSFDDMQQNGVRRDMYFYRHGGDIQGIIDKLDYLAGLGITALWINPLVENDQPYESYHGYAPTDHYTIDKRFGNNELYKELVDKCREKGIKVVMDVIYNHVGDQHWFIQDIPSSDWIYQYKEFTKTTYRAPTLMDPYASQYDRMRMSKGWFDNHMPDLNQQNPHLARYLIQNSIWWVEYAGISAFRVDTYAYPDQQFMADWARAIREEYPGLHMFAETWVHGLPVQAFFTQNNNMRKDFNSHMPAVTDFQLYYAINEALTKEQGWTDGVIRIYYTLAQDFLYEDPYRNVIFLDNHDLSRFYSVIGENIDKFKSGIAFLLTMRGIPMMYYGTEILMKNFTDPEGRVRQDFPGGWPGDKVNKFQKTGRSSQEQEAFEYVRTLANYRKNNPALQTGKLVQFVPENGIYVYFRYNDDKKVMVVMNTHAKAAEVKLDRYGEMLAGHREGVDVVSGEKVSVLEGLKVGGFSTLVLELR